MSEPLLGAVEGGGTKFVCAVGHSPTRVLESITLPTSDPGTTLGAVLEFFAGATGRHGPIRAFGVASFGPLDLRPKSATFGRLLSTPKPGWSGTDLITPLRTRFKAPVSLNTDVCAAALAELSLGAGLGVRSLAYVTVGTGIGGGFAPAGWNELQLLHPELGHIQVRRDPRDAGFAGTCPYHGDCLEGLACGPSIRARWGVELGQLDESHLAWSLIGGYLGQLVATLTLVASPERIVLGGGVSANPQLLPHIRDAAYRQLNGYIPPLQDPDAFAQYVCSSGLKNTAGLAGAFILAQQALG